MQKLYTCISSSLPVVRTMFKVVIATILLNCLLVKNVYGATDKVICYYTGWARNFLPSDIDTNICTHIIYAFLGIESDGSLKLSGSDSVVKKLEDLKQDNSNLKLLFSVGGWSQGSEIFSSVAANSTKLDKMASSALEFIKKYNFDGIDIDWEYPAKRGGKSADKKNFVTMLETLRNKLKDDNKDNLLTVAVGSVPDSSSYDAPNIADVVDFINVMTYDFVSGNKTGENAPLYPSSKASRWQKAYASCDAAIKNWTNKGASSSKLNLGLAFYGQSQKLKNSNVHGMGAPTDGSRVSLHYSEICKNKIGWTEDWDDEQKVPYKYKGLTWISYDNPASIKLKVEYAKKKKLGGVMIWAVNQDDKNGDCGTKFALLKEVKKNL